MADSLPVEKAKRGNKHYFRGFKLAFLNMLAIKFQQYVAEGRPGDFYDYATKWFFRKFGFTLTGKFNIEPAEDPAEQGVDNDVDENGGCTTEAEAKVYRARFQELRDVSFHCTLHRFEQKLMLLACRNLAIGSGSTTEHKLQVPPGRAQKL